MNAALLRVRRQRVCATKVAFPAAGPFTSLDHTMGSRPPVEMVVSIIDDDVSVCRALRRLVEYAGFTAETFASGRQVLDSGLSARSRCLVIDVHLGDMTGFELSRMLVAAGSRIPLIFITAHDDGETEECAWRAGAIAYLQKPIEGAAFLGAIQRAVRPALSRSDEAR